MGKLKPVLVLLLVVSFALPSAAQTGQSSTGFTGPKRQMATIIFAGLGGAVLGLSTLSFYGRPQDHLSNIAIGFGVGVITGTVVMTYRAATNPKEFYGDKVIPEWERALWREQENLSQPHIPIGWSFSF